MLQIKELLPEGTKYRLLYYYYDAFSYYCFTTIYILTH